MVGNVFQQVEHEKRKLRENLSFVGNCSRHDDVEGGEAVSGDDEKLVAEIIDVAHLAAGGGRDSREIGFSYGAHHWCGRHRMLLQKNEEDSSAENCERQVGGRWISVQNFLE